MKYLRRNYLPWTVFLTGAGVLIIEVVATRILAPYFGNTIFTVSSVLTVVLAALSVGYYIGGRLADKQPRVRTFFAIILLGGLSVIALQWMQLLFLPALGRTLPLTTGPLITSTMLFFVPSLLLGMLSPFAIKLAEVQSKGQGLGSIVGTVFFFSTMGSIVGSLAAGFVLVPRFGVGSIILGVGVGLTLLGLVPLAIRGMSKKSVTKVGAVVLVFVLLHAFGMPQTGALYNKNGVYEKITIQDGQYAGRPARFLFQDRSASGAMFLDGDDLTYDYSKYYVLHEIFVPRVERSLVIGGGAYSIPKALLQDLPQAQVDALEIEPSLVELGHQYFNVPKNEPRLRMPIADGRRYLQEAQRPYDFIFSDVYGSYYSIPMHFTTKEFFQAAYDKLSDEGLFVANIIGNMDQRRPAFLMSEIKTLQTVFPNVYLYAVDDVTDAGRIQNLMLVGHKSSQRVEPSRAMLAKSEHEVIRNLHQQQVDISRFDLASHPVLTDDYAPVESWTGELLRRR